MTAVAATPRALKVFTSVTGDGLGDFARQARHIEELGYDGLATGDLKHDAFTQAAAAAMSTKRLEIMTNLAVAFARTPMLLAIEGNDIQELSGGRFTMGLGTQIKAHITRRFDMPWSKPATRMAELVRATQHIWRSWATGEPLGFEGQFYSNTLMTPMFVPPPHGWAQPRLLCAGVGETMTEAIARVSDGMLTHGFSTDLYFRTRTLPAIERGLASSGRTLSEFAIAAAGFVVTGHDADTFTTQASRVRQQIAFYASTPAYRPVLEVHGWGAVGDELHRLSVGSDPNKWRVMATLITDEMLRTFAVVAEPHELAGALKARWSGVADSVWLQQVPGLPDDDVAEILSGLRSGTTAPVTSQL